MFAPRYPRKKSGNRQTQKRLKTARRSRSRDLAKPRRAIAPRNQGKMFDAPATWHEPTGRKAYKILTLKPGRGYCHVVTARQISARLAKLPAHFWKGLEVIQLSTMTRKKQRLPCYGLQWGCAIYLYPFCESFEEHFYTPPPPSLVIETKMYGARWDHAEAELWRLIWTESSARDYQLNNVLIHELGHMVDTWNSNSPDQERFAEWFAIEYGYRRTGGKESRNPMQRTRKRHG